MEKNCRIEDLYFLDIRARQQGFDVGDYVARADDQGVSLRNLIKNERKGISLESEMRKRRRNGLMMGIAALVLPYLINLGIIFEERNKEPTNQFENMLDEYNHYMIGHY